MKFLKELVRKDQTSETVWTVQANGILFYQENVVSPEPEREEYEYRV
jgi:hypothetical protein